MAQGAEFGCACCFKASAEDAADLRRNFRLIAHLVDDSHYSVRVLECPRCGQRSVSIFTEMIDWSQGDDAQYWSLVPLTVEESEQLIAQGEDVDARLIEQFGRQRRFLQVDHPTGKPLRVCWAEGMVFIGPHD